jgi:glucosamine kinase
MAKEINISSDLIGAARALYGKGTGIAVILGTGANSGYFNGVGIAEQIAPLGFWLGDEGSGGYIGKQFFKSYLRKDLGNEILTKFETAYGAFTRTQVLENAYQKPFPNRFFASFAQFVIENKTNPDCKRLINESLEKLFTRYLIKYSTSKDAKIGFVGSIAFYLESELKSMADKYEMNFERVIKSPIVQLTDFHLEN